MAKSGKNEEKHVYHNTDIYSALRKLFFSIQTHTGKTNRNFRYTLILPLFTIIEDMMCKVAFAFNTNIPKDKIGYLDEIINNINHIKIHIRNLYEVRQITETGFGCIAQEIENTLQQARGWKSYIESYYKNKTIEQAAEIES